MATVNKRMPAKRRSCPGVRGEASRDPRDMAKAGLPESQSPDDAKAPSVGKTPDTDATLCDGLVVRPLQPSERGASPSEGDQGDEWDAYVTLGRATGTNVGSTPGAVSLGVTECP
jgi:hypothetical protein